MSVVVRWHPKGWWQYDIKLVFDGVPYRERRKAPGSTRSIAEEYATKREHYLIRNGSPAAKHPTAPTFREFSARTIREHDHAMHHRPSTIAMKRVVLDAHLLPELGDKRMDEIGRADIARITAKLAEKKRKPKTINNVLSVLATILKLAVEWEVITKAPRVDGVRSEKPRMAFLSVEDYDRLVEGARRVGPRALALILLAGDAGLRRGEIIALEWSKVDLVRRVIVVDVSETMGVVTGTKGRSWRVLPMTTELHSALSALKHRTGRVMRGRSGRGGLVPQSVRELVEAAEAAAGMPTTGKLHILRHTFASHLAQAGESIFQLQKALGHRDTQTTQGYAHLTPESLRPLAEAINARRKALPAPTGNILETTQDEEPNG